MRVKLGPRQKLLYVLATTAKTGENLQGYAPPVVGRSDHVESEGFQ